MKKLIPALILLLVSAMVLSTSSYAWFSMNRTVSATGMSLTSTAPANLLITNAAGNVGDAFADTVWKSSIAASEIFAGKLYPASSADGIEFFAISDGQRIGENHIGGVAETGVTKFQTATLLKLEAPGTASSTGYWAEFTLYMKTTGGTDLNVYLDSIDFGAPVAYETVEVTSGSVVGLYTNDGTDYIKATGTYASGTTYYRALYYFTVDTSTFINDTTSVANYYTYDDTNDEYVACGNTDKYATGTIYYTPSGISKNVRVAIFSDNGTGTLSSTPVAIYAVDEYTTVYPIKDVDGNGVFTARTTAEGDVNTLQGNNTATFDVLANGTEVTELLVKVWIEGQHPDCVNAVAGQAFNIGLTFKTVETNQGA